MITTELIRIWITSDGNKFFKENEAIKHEESIQPKDIVEQWLDRIKGE